MRKQVRELIERSKRNTGATHSAATRCALCLLPELQRLKIEAELVDGDVSLSNIGKRLGVDRSSVHRHIKNHLLPRMKSELTTVTGPDTGTDDGLGAVEALERLTVRAESLPLYKRVMRLAITAEKEKNWPAARAFLSEARQLLELAGRANGEFSADAKADDRKPFVVIISSLRTTPGAAPGPPMVNDDALTIDVAALGE